MARALAVVVAIVVAGLAVAIAADGTAPTAQAASGCSKTRENQRLRVTLPWRYRLELSRVDNGQLTVRRLVDQTRSFGTIDVGGATCKRPDGAWRVIDPIAVGYSSVGIDAVGRLRSSGLMRGWGIGIRSGAGGSSPRISLQIMHCGQGNFFATLKTLSGVPVPFMPYTAAATIWAGGMFLPKDKIRCGDLGVKPLRVYASPTGVLRVADLSTRDFHETKFTPSATGGWNVAKRYLVMPIVMTGP